ncbi:MAG: lipid-A-disaccharide synthase [Kiritimatiellae bacterium]|nr:lipid-A-disaccharide synthase [Kiritimatiellia bacterium]
MKILVLAGEESGQIYARRIREMLPGHEVRGYEDYGFKTADLAVMGFVAVLRRIRYFLNVKAVMERAILEWRPDVVCTIDYPGMNLKLAAFAKVHGIRTVHVVCPQVWAWKSGRIPKIEASVDRLCCFLPFEPAMFRPGFAEFVGHPLAEEFAASARDGRAARAEFPHPLVAVLPGSRIGEIERNFPTMLEAVGRLVKVHAVVPAANEEAKARIEGLLAESGGGANVEVRLGGARDVLRAADCAIVASGTATLEAALARCPTVLVYRVSAALAWFARRVIKGVCHIGLVNVMWEKSGGTGEAPMPELLQEDFTAERTAAAVSRWLADPVARADAAARLDAMVKPLEEGPSAFARIVDALLPGK